VYSTRYLPSVVVLVVQMVETGLLVDLVAVAVGFPVLAVQELLVKVTQVAMASILLPYQVVTTLLPVAVAVVEPQ
jgi:hypothetical protein